MNVAIGKKDLLGWLILVYIGPIILSIVMISQWDEKKAVLMTIIIGIIWLIAIIITIFSIREAKNNPYPSLYLVDYDTLIDYMKDEEKYSFDNELEAGFHYYIYNDNKKIEVQSWHFIFSRFDSEKSKGNIYYWNKEEFDSLESLIANRIKNFDGYILIELIDCDNMVLNEFRKNHKELDVKKYIEELKSK